MINQKDFDKYLSTLKEPNVNRENAKYYSEVQRIAIELMHYLKMNDNKNEHVNQGNWNMTYFRENLKKEDFKFLTMLCMKRIPTDELRQLIREVDRHDDYLLEGMSGNSKNTSIERSEIDRYLAKRIISYVGFGLLMGFVLAFGLFTFLA